MLEITKEETDLKKLLSLCEKRTQQGSFKYFTEISLTHYELGLYRELFERYENSELEFCFAVPESGPFKPLIFGYSDFEIAKIKNAEIYDYSADADNDEIIGLFEELAERGCRFMLSETIAKEISRI